MNKHLLDYCNTGNIYSLRLIDKETRSFLIPAARVARDVYADRRSSVYYRRSIEILDTFAEPNSAGECKEWYGMRNTGNSCYLDSVLFALFAVPDDFIDKNSIYCKLHERPPKVKDEWNCGENAGEDLMRRQNIQNALREMVDVLRKKAVRTDNVCYDLREAMGYCKNLSEYAGSDQQDAGEFLIHILEQFDGNISVASKTTTTYVTNDPDEQNYDNMTYASRTVDNKASIIWLTDGIELSSYPKNTPIDIRQFLTKVEDSGMFTSSNLFKHSNGNEYSRRVSFTTLISSPYLIFYIQRLNPIDNKKYTTPIYPAEVITLSSGDRFCLSAIVVHSGGAHGGHYTSYVRCNDSWVFYNDIGRIVRRIGTFVDLLKARDPMTNGTLYYYRRC